MKHEGSQKQTKPVVHLDLHQEQIWQWYGHIFVYLACCAFQKRTELEAREVADTIVGLGGRLFALCRREELNTTLDLTEQERLAMLSVLDTVQTEYESSPRSEDRTRALAHLFACRKLIRQVIVTRIDTDERNGADASD